MASEVAIPTPPPPPTPPPAPVAPISAVTGTPYRPPVGGSPAIGDFATMLQTQPEKLAFIIQCWELRLKGYATHDVAEKLNISIGTVSNYWKWAIQNLPSAAETAEDFVRVSVDRLEMWQKKLESAIEKGDISAINVASRLVDQQAKLLGVYSMKLDVKADVRYSIEGVDMSAV